MKKRATRNRDKGRRHLSGKRTKTFIGGRKTKKKEENVASENKLLSEIPKKTSLFRAPAAGDNDDSPGDVLVEEESATDDETVREATSLHEIPADFACGDEEAVGNIIVEQPPDSDTSVETVLPVNYLNDIGLWLSDIDDCFRDHWLEKGSSECRHATTNFEKSVVKKENDHPRYCNFFSRVHPKTGERLEHSWLCYSESAGKLFCFICRFMSDSDSLFTSGFNDWGKGHEKIEAYRSSPQHRNSVCAAILRNKLTTVDKHLADELEREITYWRAVLMRVLDVLKFLCERGLAIRGKDETTGSVHNGNFLGIMELLS